MTDVSVVVATRDRSASLARLLAALEEQTLPRRRFEIVVVDDGSRDDTRAILAAHAEHTAGPFRVLCHETSRGPAAARNHGWRASESPVVAFTDDDCRPEKTWLDAGLRASQSGVAVLMGRTRADHGAAGYGEPFSRTMECDHEDGRYPTCNVFYLRDALEAVGGFDETFLHACGEDTDLAWRVRAAGFMTGFSADAIVEHEVRPPSFSAFLSERTRFAEQVRLVARHPEARRLFYRRWLYRRSHVHALATLALFVAALVWPTLALVLPILWLDRFRGVSLGRSRPRLLVAAQVLVGDLWELAVFARASMRHRTLLL